MLKSAMCQKKKPLLTHRGPARRQQRTAIVMSHDPTIQGKLLTSGTTALLLGLIRPGADASLVVVHQTIRAGDHVELAVHAVVELAALLRVFVGEVTVLARAMQRGDWGFWGLKSIC